MKRLSFVLFMLFLICSGYSDDLKNYLSYCDPLPSAKFINKKTTIIMRPSQRLLVDKLLGRQAVSITGSSSGIASYSVRYDKATNTVMFIPEKEFDPGETVRIDISVNSELFSYSFQIRSAEPVCDPYIGLVNELSSEQINAIKNHTLPRNSVNSLPNITVGIDNNPALGKVFVSNVVLSFNVPNSPNLLILNNNGTPYYAQALTAQAWNLNYLADGRITYYSETTSDYLALNSSYNVVDSFKCGNGYYTDLHELRVLPNGHGLLLSYDPEIVDMSQIYPGGRTGAEVVGLIIQEVDVSGNVVFQWRSWDHFSILDATHENFTSNYIDYVHGNALEVDNDQNILLSSRHMDEITKINRQTGDIIWRLGGKNNQFTFINDPIRFSHQHAIRRIANGNITMFDNGNYHTPPHSRAVEYSLDEVNKTATQVWQYRNTPDYYGIAMGYVQRLSNNNTLICWGATNPTVTEVTYSGVKAWEMTFDAQVYSYRAYKYLYGDTLTSVTGNNGNIPSEFSLNQNYPNPFNPNTVIKFQVASDKFIKLVVYDARGTRVASLVDQKLSPGKYQFDWDGTDFPSGVYFYQLIANDELITTKKMVLLK